MPTAATVTDVEDFLGVTIAADTVDRVERLLERAEQIIAAELPGFTFGASSETVTLYGDGDDYLVLPRYPVSAVTACSIDGVALDVSTDVVVDNLGRLRRLSASIGNPHGDGSRGRWPDDGTAVVVTYDYGVGASSCPPVVSAIVTELVAGRYTNPTGVTQESLGDRSRMFPQTSAGGAGDNLSAGQLHRLRHWKRNRVASARVRA